MRRVHTLFSLAVVSLGLTACTGPEQPAAGEALLAFNGSIDLTGAQLTGELGAAIAFGNDESNALYIAAAATEGDFPSSFTATLGEAPPAAALHTLDDGEPKLAYGYITAVAADHPASLRIANGQTGHGGCGPTSCVEEQTWCSEGNDPADDLCYTESSTCDANKQNCTVVATGDVTLKTGPWATVAGMSSNYLVLYLQTPARARSVTSTIFAKGRALGAGYHLLAIGTDGDGLRSYTVIDGASAQALSIQLTRGDDAFTL